MHSVRVFETTPWGCRELTRDEVHEMCSPPKEIDDRLKSLKKDSSVPKVGDTVTLNDTGIEQCFGSKAGLSHMKSLRMKVTWVDDTSMTYPEPTFTLEVDNPDINMFLIDNHCFNIITP